jgi:hypothetical protein
MAQILQTKTKETRDGATYYTADYVLTAGESIVSVQTADTPGTVQGVAISDADAGLKRARVTTRVLPVAYTFSFAPQSGGSTSNSTVELVAGARTEPIETFSSSEEQYNFADLSSASIKAVKDAVNADAEAPTSGAELNLYRLLLQGVTSYLAPSTVMRFTFVSSSPPSLVNLMKTITPVGAPDLPGGGNWLFTNCSYVLEVDQSGDPQYRITEEYTASGPGGWNANIYPPAVE